MIFSVRFALIILLLSDSNLLDAQMQNVRVQKVWEQAGHNAFPDIRYYKGMFYMVFRESNIHAHEKPEDDGKIRVLRSADGSNWRSFQLISRKGFDLRDPMLEVTSGNRLMLLMGGSIYDGKHLRGAVNHVSFLDKEFSNPIPVRYAADIASNHNWLWSITWHRGTGYGVVYQFEPGEKNKLMLVTTTNGIDYTLRSELKVAGKTSESKVWFINNKQMMMVIRRDGEPATGVFGVSKKPFINWEFKDMGIRLGGPHLARISKRYWILATRGFVNKSVSTSLFVLDRRGEIKKLVDLPECGNWDCSYPGMDVQNGNLFVSYYSAHEDNKAKIYLATIPLGSIKKHIR